MTLSLLPTLLAIAWAAVILIGILYFSRNRNFAAKHGRIAVSQLLERRGQTLISLQARPLSKDSNRDGLSGSSMLFDAVVRTGDGDHRTYRLAFDPSGAQGGKAGLKQLDDGAWRDAT